ncbi:hypothetical protein SLNWT_5563 [Streptomyces albus]|uniref:Small hydrophobic protein n=1 Tax=Streptomyces albus (strain ATCC 21838 / DSM 41398 / FERM P-419 / JCM 4703 / NBRC 107858) TaxID=1081613 RepID=A0A0B5EVX1_STRA4|nr:hypothetical protein SLNWT_5563 [Streptomyces albus]AOU80242.1 hypothetical protein SLNHY_5551 [Streptomyces albus]AYN35956.1 hypothetical protein DUI70_5461 [Streptomyces albus]
MPEAEPSPAPAAPSPAAGTAPARHREAKFPRAHAFRLFVYLAGGHLFAAFLWLLFALGGK